MKKWARAYVLAGLQCPACMTQPFGFCGWPGVACIFNGWCGAEQAIKLATVKNIIAKKEINFFMRFLPSILELTMLYFCIKVLLSAFIIAAVSELSKRNALLGAILASVPLVSVLAMTWLYIDTHNSSDVAELAQSVLWMILPSLMLFLILPILLKQQMNFYLALIISLAVMVVCYFLMIVFLKKFGIKI